MYSRAEQTKRGFSVSLTGAYQADACEFRFPEHIWKAFPGKRTLIDELSYICTLPTPVILKYPVMEYNTAQPKYFDFYHHCFNQAVPNLVEPVPSENADIIYQRFNHTHRQFNGSVSTERLPVTNNWDKKKVVLPFSFGKDSLLTLATLIEFGYEVVLVTIDERVLPRAKAIKKKMESRLKAKLGLVCHTVENEVHLLCDYQVLHQPETRLHQVHIYFVYLWAMLPFCYYYHAPLIVFNNEFHHNLMQLHKDNYLCRHRYMQSREAVNEYSGIMQDFTRGQIKVANLIDVIDNFAIHRLLHEHFTPFGEFRVSCHMEMTDFKRWCHDCYRCARAFIFFSAMGIDPYEMGFEASMLSRDKKIHFCVFDGPHHQDDQYRHTMSMEEELAFLLTFQRGVKGPLMELFRKMFLSRGTHIKERIASLKKKVFCLQSAPGASTIEKASATFYETILGKMEST